MCVCGNAMLLWEYLGEAFIIANYELVNPITEMTWTSMVQADHCHTWLALMLFMGLCIFSYWQCLPQWRGVVDTNGKNTLKRMLFLYWTSHIAQLILPQHDTEHSQRKSVCHKTVRTATLVRPKVHLFQHSVQWPVVTVQRKSVRNRIIESGPYFWQ